MSSFTPSTTAPAQTQPVQGSNWGQTVANLFPGYVLQQQQLQQIAQSQATTKNLNVEAKARELELQNRQQRAKIMQDIQAREIQARQQGAVDNQIQAVMDRGMALLSSGQVEEGSQLLERGYVMQAHSATARREQDTREQQQHTRSREDLQEQETTWAGINSQDTLDAAAFNWATNHPNTPNPFEGKMYTPALREFYLNTTKAGREYQNEQRLLKDSEERRKLEERQSKFFDSRTKYLDKMNELHQSQIDRAKKTGGVVAAAPPALRTEAEDRIKTKYSDLPQREIEQAGFDIANRAMALVKTNPGLDEASALDQAFGEAEKAQNFKAVNENYKIFGVPIPGTGKRTAYSRTGEAEYPGGGQVRGKIGVKGQKGVAGSANNPLPLPASKDPTELHVGKIYSDGQIQKIWTERGWQDVEEAGIDEEGNPVMPEDTE